MRPHELMGQFSTVAHTMCCVLAPLSPACAGRVDTNPNGKALASHALAHEAQVWFGTVLPAAAVVWCYAGQWIKRQAVALCKRLRAPQPPQYLL
jgi:hypothetical protein